MVLKESYKMKGKYKINYFDLFFFQVRSLSFTGKVTGTI